MARLPRLFRTPSWVPKKNLVAADIIIFAKIYGRIYGVPLGSKVCIFSGTKNNFSATKNNISGTKK